ncbi:TRIC cation channel family protein [Chloroflexota bacterium]
METLLHCTDLSGVAVITGTGALAARKKRMDFMGVGVLAVVNVRGGGTLRDAVLSVSPILRVPSKMPGSCSVSEMGV